MTNVQAPARRVGGIGVYAMGVVAGQAISAATTPVLTRVLGPAEFGLFEVVSVFITLATTLLLAGLDQAMVRAFYEDKDEAARARVTNTGFVLVLASSVGGCLLLAPFSAPLARLLLGRGASTGLLLAGLVSVAVGAVAAYVVEVVRVDDRPGPYAWFGILRGLVSAAAGLLLVVAANRGPGGVVLGLAIGSAVALAYGASIVRHRLHLRFDGDVARRILKFGLPLIPSGIAFWSLMVVDRVVLVHWVSLREVGFYALGSKVGLLLLWVVYGFRAAWTPSILDRHLHDPAAAAQERAAWFLQLMSLTALGAAVLGVLSTELITLGGGEEFRPAARIVPLVVVAILLFASTIVVQAAILISRRTNLVALHTAVSAAVNLVACLVLVPIWGIYGAGVATVLGFGYLAVGYYRSAQRIDRIEFPLARVLITCGLVAPYLLLGQVQLGPLLASICVKLAAVAALAMLMDATGLLPVSGLASLRDAVRRRTGPRS